jgi:N-acetylmuramoyl-L-alanine amidase
MKLQESRMLALSIQRSLAQNIKRHNKKVFDVGVKTGPFVVLLGVDAPSVLTEVSCISSHAEERKLRTERYREDIASYLEDGIVNYLRRSDTEGTMVYETKTERVAENREHSVPGH